MNDLKTQIRGLINDNEEIKLNQVIISPFNARIKTCITWPVVVAQLVEQSLSTPEVRGSNSVNDKKLN